MTTTATATTTTTDLSGFDRSAEPVRDPRRNEEVWEACYGNFEDLGGYGWKMYRATFIGWDMDGGCWLRMACSDRAVRRSGVAVLFSADGERLTGWK